MSISTLHCKKAEQNLHIHSLDIMAVLKLQIGIPIFTQSVAEEHFHPRRIIHRPLSIQRVKLLYNITICNNEQHI